MAIKPIVSLVLTFTLVVAGVAQADSQPESQGEPSPWKGSALSGGMLMNTGNTESRNITTNLALDYTHKRWVYNFNTRFNTQHTKKDGTTAFKLYSALQAQFNITQYNFAFAQTSVTDDHFDGYVYTANQSVGLGRRLIDDDSLQLDFSAGPGLQEYRLNSGTAGNKVLPSGLVGTNVIWTITQSSYLKESLQMTSLAHNTRTSSVLSLITTLSENIGFQVSWDATYDSKPVEASRNTNTITSLQLVYNI